MQIVTEVKKFLKLFPYKIFTEFKNKNIYIYSLYCQYLKRYSAKYCVLYSVWL